jgi:diguanylate cyclase (GGDEF)-like protein/PAS domain S-box-containing protein
MQSPDPAAARAPATLDGSNNSAVEQERLLVIDDEEVNRDVLSRRLRRAGYAVETANDAPEGLRKVSESSFDMVLTDNLMPGMSGIELLKEIRKTTSASELPVIIVSAVSESDQIVAALSLGANDYITKPIDFSVAIARIRTQLARRHADRAMRANQESYALAALGAKDGVWDWNLATDEIAYSPRWKELLGYLPEEIQASKDEWFERIHPEDRVAVEREIARYLEEPAGREFYCEHRLRHRDGIYRWMLCRGGLHKAPEASGKHLIGSLADITTSKSYDALTGLPNRLLLIERLTPLIEQCRKSECSNFALLFIDLDGFKLVNDSLGHTAGDHLLKNVAKRLQEGVRAKGRRHSDEVVRFGGDEFVALLTDLERPSQAMAIGERLLERLRAPFSIDRREIFVAASIGVAMADPRYAEPGEMIRDADTAMYTAKSSGRSCVRMFDEGMRTDALERLELQNDLASAIPNGELALYYQPKVHIHDGKCFGFEALVRWNRRGQGFIPPVRFISIAEETGLIIPVGTWVLKEACRQLKEWQERFPSDPLLQMSVNVSVKQLEHPQFLETVMQVLRESGIPAQTLQLEMTESVVAKEIERISSLLRELKALGISLSVDDFGTGYSSLNRLDRYPFDNVKIDRSFIVRMDRDERSAQVVRGILTLTRNLKMDVIAEGVERESQAARLLEFGCRSAQGHLYSEAVSATNAEKILREAAGLRPPQSGAIGEACETALIRNGGIPAGVREP